MTHEQSIVRVPVRTGLFSGSLDNLEDLRLSGSKCSACNETSLGRNDICPNCGRQTTHETALGRSGTLWTFTVVRSRPPGDYKGPQPFSPFGLGLVELPEGLRVMAPILCDPAELRIGTVLRMHCIVQHIDDQGRQVVAFAFRPAA